MVFANVLTPVLGLLVLAIAVAGLFNKVKGGVVAAALGGVGVGALALGADPVQLLLPAIALAAWVELGPRRAQ